jgi:hypothetical protein
MWKMRIPYILVGKPEGQIPFGRAILEWILKK